MKTYRPHASSVGDAAANLICVACYVSMLLLWNVGFVPILIIFFMEKKSGLVRFHAIQALLMWVVNILAGGGLAYEGLAALLTGDTSYFYATDGWMSGAAMIFVRALVSGLVILFSLAALGKAYRWQDWRIPFVGQLAMLIVRHCAPVIYNGEGRVPHGCERGYRDYARPEWKAKWERKDGETFQDMLPPPQPPRPVMESIRAGEDVARRQEVPPPTPRYAAYADEEIVDVDYREVVEEPEDFRQQTISDIVTPPAQVPAFTRPEARPQVVEAVLLAAEADDGDDDDTTGGSKWYVEPMHVVDYNEQVPNYMRDPDPVTGWMEDPLPDHSVAPATAISRAAAPVPQNMKYSVSGGNFFGRKSGKAKAGGAAAKGPKKRREDDPNDQLPDFMRDPPSPFEMD